MSGLFASLSLGRSWEKVSCFLRLFSATSSSSASHQDDLNVLRKLERTIRQIRATLHDAEEHWNIREESVKLRLKELKEVAYDIEDVVDEYEYEVNRCNIRALEQADGVHSTGKRKHQEEIKAYSMDRSVVAVPYDLVLRARKITDRFNEIIPYSEHMSSSENDWERRFDPDITSLRHTTSVLSEESILVRVQDRDKVIDKLLSREGEDVGSPLSVMAIVGMGAVGKTTLAQAVYESPRVSQSFEKHAWVCVSEHFDVSTITRNIIASLTSQECKYTELASLQGTLANQINGRRVLLVLDGVWNEQRDFWELFFTPLTTSKMCQIIVTTRSEAVARMIQTMPFYHLDCLSFDESWSLFCKAACIGEQEADNDRANLIEIGKSIVKRCKGLPLAIRTLGSMLRYETDERRWKDVLESELWDIEQPWNEVLPALELSYKHMPVYLRRCLLSLSLYPKHYHFYENQVLRLWKSLDLFHCNGSDDEYAIGRFYLKELVQRFMLQTVYSSGSYYLHDLIHDLACFLAGEEFCRLEGNPLTEIPQNVRYMSIHKYITAADISVFPNSLRAIIVIRELGNMNQTTAPEALFSNCKKLRVLDLKGSRSLQMVLPDYLGNLKLLRHLLLGGDLSMPLTFDPNRIWEMHIENLVLSGIGNLINVHTLPNIRVCGTPCSFNIRELRNINEVRKLYIGGLSNARHVKYADEAQLHRKKHLRSLNLDFSIVEDQCPCGLQQETGRVTHHQLLDSLRPHCNLRKLIISDYNSEIYPRWLGDPSFFMLTSIRLINVQSKHLPVLAGLPSLKYLSVTCIKSMEDIGNELFRQLAGDKYFPSLTNLEFTHMSEWSEWSGVGAFEPPCLNELSLLMCEKLRSLPLEPLRGLVTLNVRECHSIDMVPALPALRDLLLNGCSSLREIPVIPSLLKLYIFKCRNLRSIGSHPSHTTLQQQGSACPNASPVSSLPKLTSLDLRGCPNLSAVGHLPSLAALKLEFQMRDELLYSLLNDLPSLEYLEIFFVGVTCIHLKQRNLPSLTRLCLGYCSNLQYCDGLASLTSLEHLEVKECPKLPIYNLHPPQLKTLSII